jgi:deoxyribonuclease-4
MNGSKILIGRHIPLKYPDYLLGSAKEAIGYGSNSLMIYMGSPQNSFRKEVSYLKVEEFKNHLIENDLDLENVFVHGSYLVNLGNIIDKGKLNWSINFLKSEISRMEEIGLKTLIIHPGSSLGYDRELSLLNISNSLNDILNSNSNVRIALETMSGRTNELGINFEEIKFIINNVEMSERIGVCWDTCHLYSSGYDIRSNLDEVIQDFKDKIGIDKLWVIHLNDTLFDFGSRKDRHANIGYGKLGFDCLREVVYHKEFKNIAKILETPTKNDLYKYEINLLKKSI